MKSLSRYLTSVLFLLLLTIAAAAQNYQVPAHSMPVGRGPGFSSFHSAAPSVPGQVLLDNGTSADPSFGTISTALDLLGTSQGSVLFRGASGWIVLGPGTSGNCLTTGGVGANPAWASCSAGGGGITQLTGDVTAGPGSGSQAATVGKINGVSLAGLGTGILINTTGTGVPSVVAAPTGAVVGTSDAQTMTNKVISGASNTISNINLASQVTGTLGVGNGGTGTTTSTGTGSVVRSTSPALVTPALGTPASGVATNLTGTAAGLTAGTVTTNANLTGPITSVGNATSVTNNAITLAMMAQAGANTMLGNWSGSTANVAANAMPSCADASGNHLNYVNGTGVTCGTSTPASNVTVGTTTITSGASGNFEYNNAGVLGEKTPAQVSTTAMFTNAGTGASAVSIANRFGQVFSIFDYGAVCNGSNDDTTAIQNTINAAEASGTVQTGAGGAAGIVFAPAGYNCKITSSLSFHKPIDVNFRSFIGYTPTTGSALIFQPALPTTGQNQGWHVYIAGLRATNGNSSLPTSINASGTTGVEIRNMQFSSFDIGEIIAFTNVGFYCNASDSAYTGQTIQDNTFHLGQIAYNGQGFYGLSASGNDSCGANTVNIDNVFANWVNIQLDNSTTNPSSTSNTFNITALDAPATGGSAAQIWADYNWFRIGFLDHPMTFNSTSVHNQVNVQNDSASGCSFTDNGTSNWLNCGSPDAQNFPSAINVGKAGTAAGTVGFNNATSGKITLSPPTGALGTPTLTLPAATDTLVGRATTDTFSNKTVATASVGDSSTKLASTAYADQKWIVVSKSADQNIISNTTLTNDSSLSFSMLANTKYRIRLTVMVMTTSASAGWKFGFTAPASPTVVDSSYLVINAASLSQAAAEALQSAAFALNGTAPLIITMNMMVQNGSNAGTFQFQWAQNTSTATNVTVRAGSTIEYAVD